MAKIPLTHKATLSILHFVKKRKFLSVQLYGFIPIDDIAVTISRKTICDEIGIPHDSFIV